MNARVYEALADCFVSEGTSSVFGMMGTANQHWLNVMVKRGTRFYGARDEGPGLAMAEGYAVASGRVGVCTTTSGPGVTQLATAMVVASRSRTPLVAFCGDEPANAQGQSHSFDQERFAAAIEARFVRLQRAEDVHETVRTAFSIARFDSRPVILSAPLDVQMSSFSVGSSYEPSSSAEEQVAAPQHDDIQRAADLIASSRLPVVLLGRGAVLSDCGDIALRVASRIGALVTTSMRAMNWPIQSDSFHVGISGGYSTTLAAELFDTCDCVISVGASLNLFTTASGRLFPKAKIVQIDVRPSRPIGDGRSAACYIQSDASLALTALEAVLAARSFANAGYRVAEVETRLREVPDHWPECELEPGTIDPRQACRTVDRCLPAQVGLVFSGSHAPNMAIRLSRAPRRFTIVNKEFGGMGKGLSAAVGAAVGADSPVAVVEGDAGFMLHLSEFETAARYGLPLLVIVMNDQALGSELHDPGVARGELDPALARISTPDLGAVARSLGGSGSLVRTLADLREGIKNFVDDPVPALLDVRISSNIA